MRGPPAQASAPWRADLLAMLVIVAAVLLANLPAVTGWLDPDPLPLLSGLDHGGRDGLLPGSPGWTDPNTGTTTQALGHLSALDWLRGVVPWWNPYSGVGLPLAGAAQPASLFLPFVLLLALPKGMLALKIAMQVVAGLGTWALLRRLGLMRLGAVAGAILFALNGTFGWHGAYAPALPPAFVPLMLLGVEHAAGAARARRPGGLVALAAGLAWSLYAGFPETAYIDGLLVAAWSLLRVLEPAAAGRRLAILLRIGLGGLLGLMLAAPFLVPFAEYVRGATLAERGIGFGMFAPLARFTALNFFPHVFGLPSGLWTYDTERVTPNLFALNGGWLGLSALFLATLAVLTPGRQRGLRLLLAGWIVASLLKTMAVPGVTQLVNLLPGAVLMPWFRYGPPSWEMAGAVLAAMAVDDWARGAAPRVWRAAMAGTLVLATTGATLYAGLPVFRSLLRTTPDYAWYLGVSVGGALALLAALAGVWWQAPRGRWRAAMLVAATLEAGLLFLTPMLAGRRDVAVDTGIPGYLQRHLGLQRFVSWGSIQGNYGAWWRIASINYEYIPIPPAWLDRVLTRLDPAAEIFAWRGRMPTGPDGRPLDAAARLNLVPEYEALGVKYVVVRRGLPGFESTAEEHDDGARTAFGLAPGAGLAGSLSGAVPRGGTLRDASVLIGTYAGAADGRLEVELCAAAGCAGGSAEVAGAGDNAPLLVMLAPALPVRAGETLHWRITHRGGGVPVAIWMAAGAGPQDSRPVLEIDAAEDSRPLMVHAGPAALVWELPDPKPYFETQGGPCRLAWHNRDRLDASCDAPARLLRRELFYPGWNARVNGAATPVGQADGLFQEIALPAGTSSVRFTYAPPFIAVAAALCALAGGGLLPPPGGRAGAALAAGVFRRRPGGRARPAGRRVSVLAGFAVLLALRIPAIWPYGRLWAEEGTVYLANALSTPWYLGLFTVHTGYLNLAASGATTLAAHLVALQYIPLVTVLVALLFQLCPAILLAVSGIPWLRDWRVLAVACLLVALPPLAEEVWLNSITSQFHIMLAVAIILAVPVGRGAVGWFQGAILALAPLSGPGGAILLPLFVVRALLDRSSARLLQAVLLVLGVAVQVWVVLTHPEPARAIGLDIPIVLAAITGKQILLPLIGPSFALHVTRNLPAEFAAGRLPVAAVLAPFAAFGAIAVAAWRSRSGEIRWLFAGGMLIMAVSYLAALTPTGPRELLAVNFGTRYYFVPAVLTGLTLLGIAATGRRIARPMAGLMVGWLLLVGAVWYTRPMGLMSHGPRWPDEVAAWRADPAHLPSIWPSGWTVRMPPPDLLAPD